MCVCTYLINHGRLVQHIRIEESVSKSNVGVHFAPVRGHAGQHRADQGVTEAERGARKGKQKVEHDKKRIETWYKYKR